jgi:hypothetical protein
MAFNEKFGFERPDQLKEEYKKGRVGERMGCKGF